MKIYNRQEKVYEEEIEYQKEALEFLYNTILGRIILKLLVSRPIFSKIRAKYYKSSKSKKEIKKFIEKNGIDGTELNYEQYKCFNDFFIRKKSYFTETRDNELMAIADSRLSVYSIDDNLLLHIKNTSYSVEELVGSKEIPEDIKGGKALVFRLSVNDYHRYVNFDDGKIIKQYYIKGKLHTVRPISERYRSFSANCRNVSVLKTKYFGTAIQIDIGALLIGHMVEHNFSGPYTRLSEKGYFEYGGSTIVLLLNNKVVLDDDIVYQSELGYETKVTIGEKIGQIC